MMQLDTFQISLTGVVGYRGYLWWSILVTNNVTGRQWNTLLGYKAVELWYLMEYQLDRPRSHGFFVVIHRSRR